MFPYTRTRSHFLLYSPNSAFQTVGMLFLFLIRGSLVLSVFTVFSSALPSPLKWISSPLKSSASLKTRALNTTSVQHLEFPTLSYSPYCNPSYGRNLNPNSCDNALEKISEVPTPLTFGQRAMGSYDVVLPRRYLSGTLSLESSRLN